MDIFCEYGISIDEKMAHKLRKYTEVLLEYNKKINLTAITDTEQIMIKHYLDSMLGAEFIPIGATVVDIGSGAGFPAVPLKIYRDDLKITMLDSLNKRITFLNELVGILDLDEICAIHSRAEEAAHTDIRESFDCAVARAVAELSVLVEYTLPFVKVGGRFLAYKGEAEEEIKRAERAIEILGGKLSEVKKFVLPDGSKRSIIIIEKVKKTPKVYPRGQNKPRIRPL